MTVRLASLSDSDRGSSEDSASSVLGPMELVGVDGSWTGSMGLGEVGGATS